MKPSIVVENTQTGYHNLDLEQARGRLEQGNTYKDLSTIIVIPTRGVIPARVVQNWMGLMMPMNQKTTRMFLSGMEVGEAYNRAVSMILNDPVLSTWKYILTLEEDNLPPPDGLLKLYESIHSGDYAAVGGLYWTKGYGGQPMIYGPPDGILNFIPQMPIPETVQPCRGLGMGFTLFEIDAFRKIEPPYFKTEQSWDPGTGVRMYTQDLYCFEKMANAGLKVASDNRVRVGHFDLESDIVW